jgi:outer membrane protein OmpA-like peptidoglycan-associated protein
MKNLLVICLILCMMVSLVSCASMGANEQQGTTVGAIGGAAAGAGLGQAIGRNTESTLIGAGIGLVVGALVGNQVGSYMDKQQAAMQNAMSASIAANQASVQRASEDMLMATFRSDVFFDLNSYKLKPGAYLELDRVANVLKQYPQTNIQIQGHTDSSGSEDYNMMLSTKRARAVEAYLMQSNIDPRRMTAYGMGEGQPISSNPDQNRRVVIVLTPITK